MEMTEAYAVRTDRILERLSALGLSERKASMLATGQPDTLRFIRTRGTVPSIGRMFRIAQALEATPEYLLGHTDINDWSRNRSSVDAAAHFSENIVSENVDLSRTIPVINSISKSLMFEVSGVKAFPVTMTSITNDVIGFVAAPMGAKHKKLMSTYINDPVMAPVFDNQSPVVFELDREPNRGDYAIIFLGGEFEGRELRSTDFLLRRVVDLTKEWLTLEQHTPPLRHNFPRGNAKSFARVLTLRDYVMPENQ